MKPVLNHIPKNMTIGELTREYIRVAKNLTIADPGSLQKDLVKTILQGIAVDLSTRGTRSKRSGTSPREDRSDAIREFAERLCLPKVFLQIKLCKKPKD